MAKLNTPQMIHQGFWDMVQLDPTDAPRVSPSAQYREPEKLLVLAVLEDVVYILQEFRMDTAKSRTLVKEARLWVASDAMYAFSFAWCCQHAGYDVGYLRLGIEQMGKAEFDRRPRVVRY
jgi:hypothetical protein